MLMIITDDLFYDFVRVDQVVFVYKNSFPHNYVDLKTCPDIYEKLTDEQKFQIKQLTNNDNADLLKFIKTDPCRIKHISDPSYDLQKFAITELESSAQHIKNLDKRLQFDLIKQNICYIEYIQNIDINVLRLYLKLEHYYQIEQLNQTKKCLKVLQIKRLQKITPTLDCLSEIKKLEKVKEDGYNIAYITKPSTELIDIVIETTPRSVLFVKDATYNQLYRAMLSQKKKNDDKRKIDDDNSSISIKEAIGVFLNKENLTDPKDRRVLSKKIFNILTSNTRC